MLFSSPRYIVSASIPFLEDWQKEGREIPAIRDLRGSYYARQERTGTQNIVIDIVAHYLRYTLIVTRTCLTMMDIMHNAHTLVPAVHIQNFNDTYSSK